MELYLCPSCNQHIATQSQTEHKCSTERSTRSSSKAFSIPMALLLGIGCQKKEIGVEVMALYGAPPTEEPEIIPPESPESTETEQSTTSETESPKEALPEPEEESTNPTAEPSTQQPENNRPVLPIERQIQAAYGAPPVPSLQLSPSQASPQKEQVPAKDQTDKEEAGKTQENKP